MDAKDDNNKHFKFIHNYLCSIKDNIHLHWKLIEIHLHVCTRVQEWHVVRIFEQKMQLKSDGKCLLM